MSFWIFLKDLLSRHAFTFVAAVVCVYVFLNVEQVANVWQQAPPRGSGWLFYFGYGLFFLLLTAFAVGSLVGHLTDWCRTRAASAALRAPAGGEPDVPLSLTFL